MRGKKTKLRIILRGSGSKIEDVALRILSIREHSEREIYKKLRRRGFEKDKIEELIKRLRNADIINDEKFAFSYARWRRKKLYGRIKIMAELISKGIEREIAERAIGEATREIGEEEAARTLAGKKNKKGEKLFRFLVQRGFPIEVVKEIVKDEVVRD